VPLPAHPPHRSPHTGVLGILATVFCILLFSSPLSTIKTVFEQRSSESIYAPATAAQCANCAMWTTYGLFAANDVFVWGPNLTGLLLGLVQLALKIAFPSRK
jgi:solute carrier family 50 protein (sugar transporter)